MKRDDLKNLPGIMSPMPFEHMVAAAEAADYEAVFAALPKARVPAKLEGFSASINREAADAILFDYAAKVAARSMRANKMRRAA